MITVYQLDSTKANELMTPEHGFFSTFCYGMGVTKEQVLENAQYYVRVADILCADMHEAFAISNRGDREQNIIRHERMHSISVGDILVNEIGQAFVVSPDGFDELGLDIMEKVTA